MDDSASPPVPAGCREVAALAYERGRDDGLDEAIEAVRRLMPQDERARPIVLALHDLAQRPPSPEAGT